MVLSYDDRSRDHARGVGHGRPLGQPDGGRARDVGGRRGIGPGAAGRLTRRHLHREGHPAGIGGPPHGGCRQDLVRLQGDDPGPGDDRPRCFGGRGVGSDAFPRVPASPRDGERHRRGCRLDARPRQEHLQSVSRPIQPVLASLAAGVIIGAVETVLAISFAALVFGGLLVGHLADGIGLYLGAAAITLAVLAWRAGSRGVVGGVQEAAAAVLAVVATTTALNTFGGPDRAFLTVVAATLVMTVLTGIAFFVLGIFRLGNLVRYVPYPVIGGFLAGAGWLLMKGGIVVTSGVQPSLDTLGDLMSEQELLRWIPAFAFGVLLLLVTRFVRRPLVIPILLGVGLIGFVIAMLVTGSSLAEAKEGQWLLGPFEPGRLWQPWAARAISGADWGAGLGDRKSVG